MDLQPEPVRPAERIGSSAGGPGEGAGHHGRTADLPPARIGGPSCRHRFWSKGGDHGRPWSTVLLAPTGRFGSDRLSLGRGPGTLTRRSPSKAACAWLNGLAPRPAWSSCRDRGSHRRALRATRTRHARPLRGEPLRAACDLPRMGYGRFTLRRPPSRNMPFAGRIVGDRGQRPSAWCYTLPTPVHADPAGGGEHFATAIDNNVTGRWLDPGTAARGERPCFGILLVGGLTGNGRRFPPPVAADAGNSGSCSAGWRWPQAVFRLLGPGSGSALPVRSHTAGVAKSWRVRVSPPRCRAPARRGRRNGGGC